MTDHAHLLNTFNRQNCLIAGTGLGLPDVPTKWIASDIGAISGYGASLNGSGYFNFPNQIIIPDETACKINIWLDMDASRDIQDFLGDKDFASSQFIRSRDDFFAFYVSGTETVSFFGAQYSLQGKGLIKLTLEYDDSRNLTICHNDVFIGSGVASDSSMLLDSIGRASSDTAKYMLGGFYGCDVSINGVLQANIVVQSDGTVIDTVSGLETTGGGTGTTFDKVLKNGIIRDATKQPDYMVLTDASDITTATSIEPNANGSAQVNTILAVTSGGTLTLAQWVAKHNGTTIFIAENGLRYAIFDTAQTGLDLDRALRWVGRFVVVAFVYSLDFSNSANSMYAPVVF